MRMLASSLGANQQVARLPTRTASSSACACHPGHRRDDLERLSRERRRISVDVLSLS